MSERTDDPTQRNQLKMGAPAKGGSTGVKQRTSPASPKVDRLPPYRVLLHNDDVNDIGYVVDSICDITPLSPRRAATITLEAHKRGIALLLTTHRERAELYVDQFAGKGLTVTMESET